MLSVHMENKLKRIGKKKYSGVIEKLIFFSGWIFKSIPHSSFGKGGGKVLAPFMVSG